MSPYRIPAPPPPEPPPLTWWQRNGFAAMVWTGGAVFCGLLATCLVAVVGSQREQDERAAAEFRALTAGCRVAERGHGERGSVLYECPDGRSERYWVTDVQHYERVLAREAAKEARP